MDNQTTNPMDETLSKWFSTYGIVTVERIFAQLGIYFVQNELVNAIYDPSNLYHQLLRIPFKNMLNGIILAHASDYREFAQKIFIDYLVSGAANQPEGTEATFGGAKEQVETERLQLIELGDQFDLLEFEQNKLIAESQRTLISLAKTHQIDAHSLTEAVMSEINEKMQPYDTASQTLNTRIRQFRTAFYELIVRVRDLITTIPEYQLDLSKFIANRAILDFDSNIGE